MRHGCSVARTLPKLPPTWYRKRGSGPSVVCEGSAIPRSSERGSTGLRRARCADVIRATTRRRRLDAEAVAGELSAPVEYSTAEQQIDLATAIRALPPIHRAAVHLFYLEELSVEEIASVLGVPAGTVKSRLHHARDALKRQLTAAAPGRNESESRRRGIS
jgi:predicted RNA polymerase sigma factor